jgi:hypothetical protein
MQYSHRPTGRRGAVMEPMWFDVTKAVGGSLFGVVSAKG